MCLFDTFLNVSLPHFFQTIVEDMVRLCVEGGRLPSRMHNEQLPSYETEQWCGFCIGQGGQTAYRQFASAGSLKTHIHRFHLAALDPGRPACRHQPEPGLCPRCEEEVETTENAILRCPTRQYARGSFPETLDLKSAWYDATVTEILAKFVRRTHCLPSRIHPPRGQRHPYPTLLSLLVCLPGFGASSIYSLDCTVS